MNTNLPKDQSPAVKTSLDAVFGVPEESKLEKRNKTLYLVGVGVSFVFFFMIAGLFVLYLNMDQLFTPH